MGKHDGAAVQRLAALYGLKCTAQGAGKRLTIMVRSADGTTSQRTLTLEAHLVTVIDSGSYCLWSVHSS